LEALAGQKRIAIRTLACFRFAVDRRDYIQATVFRTGRWEDAIEDTLRAELTGDDVYFDIGANVGYFSLFALQLGCGTVVSFEPNSELQALFLHNMRLNHFSDERSKLVCSALAETPGDYVYQEGPLANSGVGHLVAATGSAGIKVKTETLDTFLENSGLPCPSVIKLDVEGWELNVLRGAAKLFEKKPPRLVIFEAACDASCQITDRELVQFFEDRGYSVRHLPREPRESRENYVARSASALG
jgi:FkbM family methyltransferase